jgi:hypothetical protein
MGLMLFGYNPYPFSVSNKMGLIQSRLLIVGSEDSVPLLSTSDIPAVEPIGTSRSYRAHRSGGEIIFAAEQVESSKDVPTKLTALRCISADE